MPSPFLGIYSVLYDYTPQSDQELALKEGDLLYVLEKSEEDDWWKAKKRTLQTDEDEPEGLVPCNYIEETKPIGKAKAVYDYTRQTQEEISFTEDAILDVYDTEDPDWTLVGYNGEYGFAPTNYIEIEKTARAATPPAAAAAAEPPRALALPRDPSPPPPAPPSPGIAPPDLEKPLPIPTRDEEETPPPTPPRPVSMVAPPRERERLSAAPNRQSMHQGHSTSSASRSPKMQSSPRERALFSGHYSDSDPDDGPSLPMKRPPHERRANRQHNGEPERLHPVEGGSPGAIPPGYRSFPVNELIGKKKHAALLALGPDRIILIPDKSTNPRQEWSVENMLNYSYEGKHVFIDVNYPTKAMDLHAGSKEVASEIFAALGEISGAARASEGLRDVITAADPKYKRSDNVGTVLWDFAAGGQDEVSVTAGDEVMILDDRDHDWWMIKRTVNGAQGVVPSSYIARGRKDITEARQREKEKSQKEHQTSSSSRNNRSGNDHNRSTSSASLPSGVQLPVRTTSLAGKRNDRASDQQGGAKSKPDLSRIRTWTDRSGTFKVEAQFLGCKDGRIHLHKLNGVKIAVPVVKMSVEDLEYVEHQTGLSLDEDKPLSYVKNQQGQQAQQQQKQAPKPTVGITIEKTNDKKKEYDWFDFFLGCGIDLGDCQRYAINFQKENMDETFLPELTAPSMRNLGMKEGDILRATKFLDQKYNRGEAAKKAVSFGGAEVISDNGGEGTSRGLFSGPGGVLKNNTGRKSRPAPAVVTSDTVDPGAFQTRISPPPQADTKKKSPPPQDSGAKGGFDDDAWGPKPSKQPPPAAEPPKVATPPPPAPQPAPQPVATQPPAPPPMSAGLQDLSQISLSTPPLQPTIPPLQVTQPPPQPQPQPTVSQPPPQQPLQPTGFNPQMNAGFPAQQRQRPPAPQTTSVSSLIPPPPQRPISAPQTFQPSNMGAAPLAPQMTGIPVAPPGQMSMADQLHEMRMQQIAQQQASLQAQQQALIAQITGAPRLGSILPQPTGFQPQPTGFQPQPTGFQPQTTGFMNSMPTIQAPQPSLPSAGFQGILQQPTGMGQPGMPPQPTGMGMGVGGIPQQPVQMSVNSLLPAPLMPQQTGLQQPLQPLKPQATGPPPPVRFGVTPGQPKLAPQPTGRKANLLQATPENPFGF